MKKEKWATVIKNSRIIIIHWSFKNVIECLTDESLPWCHSCWERTNPHSYSARGMAWGLIHCHLDRHYLHWWSLPPKQIGSIEHLTLDCDSHRFVSSELRNVFPAFLWAKKPSQCLWCDWQEGLWLRGSDWCATLEFSNTSWAKLWYAVNAGKK